MRLLVMVLVVIAAWSTAAEAAVFGGWRYTAPKGFTATQSGDHLELMRITAPTFCQLTLFAARPMTRTEAEEAAFEWKNVVEKTFTVKGRKRLGTGTSRSGVPFTTTGASVSTGDGSFYVHHYVVTPGALVSSVLVVSNNSDTIATCGPAVTAFLDTLSAEAAPTPAANAAPKTPKAPAAGSPVGRWATSVAGQPNDGSPVIRRQYTLAGNGTYTHHAETWGGAYRADEWMITDEAGTYSVDGDKLTITPTTAKGVLRSRSGITKTIKVPLEKVTYTWRVHFLAGLQENNLILTTSTKTRRDGEFASSDQFPSSYMLSAKYQPQWDFPP